MEEEEEAAVVMENKQISFKGYIDRAPEITDMELKISNFSISKVMTSMEDGEILVKNLYLSCDPYMRGRMRDFHASYIPPFRPSSVPTFLLFIFFSPFLRFTIRALCRVLPTLLHHIATYLKSDLLARETAQVLDPIFDFTLFLIYTSRFGRVVNYDTQV